MSDQSYFGATVVRAELADTLGYNPSEDAPFSMLAGGKSPNNDARRRARLRWVLQVNQLEMGTLDRTKPVELGDTPAALLAVGADNLPMVMDANVADKAREKHGLDFDTLRQIFDEIHSPVAVFQSEKIGDALVVLTSLERSGEPVIAAVHLNRSQKRHEVNKIESIYPKRPEGLAQWIAAGDLRYLNQKKALPLALSIGLQLPKEATLRKGQPKILTEVDVVKPDADAAGFSAIRGVGNAAEFENRMAAMFDPFQRSPELRRKDGLICPARKEGAL